MRRRKAKYTKAELLIGAILFLIVLTEQYPFIPYVIGVVAFLVGTYFYLLAFKKYSKNLLYIKDHLFIISTVRYWTLKNKLILGIVLFSILYFAGLFFQNSTVDFIIEGIISLSIVLLIFLGLRRLYKIFKILLLKIKPTNFIETIEDVDKMNGYEFEGFLAPLFRSYGYHVEVTKKSGDFGADLIIKKSKINYAVQAKCYGEDKKVGVAAINEVVGSAGYHNTIKKIVITNRYFTKSAMITAKRNDVILLNRDELIRMINHYNQKQIKITG